MNKTLLFSFSVLILSQVKMASQPKLSHCQNPDSVITDHSLMMGTRTEMKMRRTTTNRRRTRMRMNRRKLLTNVCGESCVSCQLRVVLFPSLPITAPLFHCSPCPSQLTRISGLTGSRPTTAPSNNLPLPPFHLMSSLYTYVTKNNSICSTIKPDSGLKRPLPHIHYLIGRYSFQPDFLPPSGFFYQSKTAIHCLCLH